MKHFRAILISFIILGVVGFGGWKSRIFFLQNKVTFLLNQRQFGKANALVERLAGQVPDNLRTTFLQIKVHTLTGQLDSVTTASINENLVSHEPETLYWISLAELQRGNDAEAAQLARQYLASGDKLPDRASMDLARKLAGNAIPLNVTDADYKNILLLFPLEQAIYIGMAGLQEKELGRMNSASDLFARAFALGNRNKQIMLEGCEAAALSGNAQRAEMFLGYSGEPSVRHVFNDLSDIYDQFKTVTRTIHDQEITGQGGRLHLAHALSWAGTVLLKENISANMYPVLRVMAELQQEYPYDRILIARMADVLETLKRYSESYALYKKLYDESPNLVTALRLWTLEAIPEAELTSRVAEFMYDLAPVATLSASSFDERLSAGEGDFLACYGKQSLATTFEIPKSGTYLFTMIARGDKAFGRWPLVRVSIDGDFVDNQYICRENWDCFSITKTLDVGKHVIQIDYINDNEGIADASESRSFYMKAIYVTNPGGI